MTTLKNVFSVHTSHLVPRRWDYNLKTLSYWLASKWQKQQTNKQEIMVSKTEKKLFPSLHNFFLKHLALGIPEITYIGSTILKCITWNLIWLLNETSINLAYKESRVLQTVWPFWRNKYKPAVATHFHRISPQSPVLHTI